MTAARESAAGGEATRRGDLPQGLAKRNLEPRVAWLRPWLPLIVLGIIVAAALLGLFGGGPSQRAERAAPAATLEVQWPGRLRNGMFFEMRVAVQARRDLSDATLAIDASLWRDMTINTTMPGAGEESFGDGAIELHYGPLKAGERIEVKFDGQVNPSLLGGTRGTVSLRDGDVPITAIPLAIGVLP